MSLKVQTGQTQSITSKWELAQNIVLPAPELALRYVFIRTMQHLELMANTHFETPMKAKVWNTFSEDKLKTLEKEFIFEFCDKVLGSFDEEQATAMLAEFKSTGDIQGPQYLIPLTSAFQLHIPSIINTCVISRVQSWLPQIIMAVRNEGVELPGRQLYIPSK